MQSIVYYLCFVIGMTYFTILKYNYSHAFLLWWNESLKTFLLVSMKSRIFLLLLFYFPPQLHPHYLPKKSRAYLSKIRANSSDCRCNFSLSPQEVTAEMLSPIAEVMPAGAGLDHCIGCNGDLRLGQAYNPISSQAQWLSLCPYVCTPC